MDDVDFDVDVDVDPNVDVDVGLDVDEDRYMDASDEESEGSVITDGGGGFYAFSRERRR
jgi:hypothetical protein